jgi:site-specific DNA recombinase
MTKPKSTTGRPSKRCAIYTRKSSEEGLDQEFNSLDAQRESAEAYIKSQAHEGWRCLAERYDDGGFTGGNMDRPALKRLLADVEARRIDAVIVYKVDRLSRSLPDFARMLELFERHDVSFVSVTQQFNTGTSMGRLMLNVLLSFAQFEREMISERTRDKIAATRRKGKWAGGTPLLGYDVVDRKLVVNEPEAQQVRAIFELYARKRSLLAVVQELDARGWTNKLWTTRKGTQRGGRLLIKTSLHQLLTNATYTGKVRHKGELFGGEHAGIVTNDLFDRVQGILRDGKNNGSRTPGGMQRVLLRGLARCAVCDRAMSHSYASRGTRRYRYYVCTAAQKQGWHTCPSPSVPAAEFERFVVDEVRTIARDRALLAATWAAWGQGASPCEGGTHVTPVLLGCEPGVESIISYQETAADAVDQALDEPLGIDAFAAALRHFDCSWDRLLPHQQADLLRLVVRQVDYDGRAGKIAIRFCPAGIAKLAADPRLAEETVA